MALGAALSKEIDTQPERREGSTHRQYDKGSILAISSLKYLGKNFANKFKAPAHRKLITEPITASQILLQSNQQGGEQFTHMPFPKDIPWHEKIKKIATQSDQNLAGYQRVVTAQILRLAGYDEKRIVDTIAVAGTFDIAELIGKGIEMKIGQFFLELFKIDKKHALKNPDRHDTIGDSAGVYPNVRTVEAPEGFVPGKSDPLEVGATHALRSLFTGALQFAKDLSWQGGNHPDANRDPGLNPQAIQSGASELFDDLRSRGFARHFALNKPFIKQFDDDLKKSEEAKKCLDAPSRCLVDPCVDIIPDEKTTGEVRFHADSPTLSAAIGELNKITVCVFNLDHTQYRMADIGTIGNLGPTQIVDLIKAEKPDYQTGWTNISELSCDPIRPVFALSITKNGETPKGLIDNAGLNGESLVHYDFRVNDDGTVICIDHHGHTRHDGGNAAVYNELQGSVLPKVIRDNDPMVMELATLYPIVENPANVHELLNSIGLSNIAVGEGYNQKELKDRIKEINVWYNEAFSSQVFDVVNLELQDNRNIDAFIKALSAEHKQVYERKNLYDHKANGARIEIPKANDELEILLDNLYVIRTGNIAMQERFASYKEEINISGTTSKSLRLDQTTNPDQALKILGDNYPAVKERILLHGKKGAKIPDALENSIEPLIDGLIALKREPQFKEALASIGSTASMIRNLISPNISEVHLFDMYLASRGGVVNCTLPLFDYLRLETSMVKNRPYLKTILDVYQKIDTIKEREDFIAKYPEIIGSFFADLEANLLDQTFARLGLPTTGHLLAKAGGAPDQVGFFAKHTYSGIAEISRNAYAQTSFLPGLVKFISALQADMQEENLAVSGTDDGHGNGYLCYRANLAKPESQDLFLNMLDVNVAVDQYKTKLLEGYLKGITGTSDNAQHSFIGRTPNQQQIKFVQAVKDPIIAIDELETRLLDDEQKLIVKSIIQANKLTITQAETKKGMKLGAKLQSVLKNSLSEERMMDDDQKKVVKDILVLALQNDLHQTITSTQSLAEMLALYSLRPKQT